MYHNLGQKTWRSTDRDTTESVVLIMTSTIIVDSEGIFNDRFSVRDSLDRSVAHDFGPNLNLVWFVVWVLSGLEACQDWAAHYRIPEMILNEFKIRSGPKDGKNRSGPDYSHDFWSGLVRIFYLFVPDQKIGPRIRTTNWTKLNPNRDAEATDQIKSWIKNFDQIKTQIKISDEVPEQSGPLVTTSKKGVCRL